MAKIGNQKEDLNQIEICIKIIEDIKTSLEGKAMVTPEYVEDNADLKDDVGFVFNIMTLLTHSATYKLIPL
jgi:hypothetical protein